MGLTKYSRPRNPTGRNQWAGDRAKQSHGFRLPAELDRIVRAYVEDSGITLTQFWESLAWDFAEDMGYVQTVTFDTSDPDILQKLEAAGVDNSMIESFARREQQEARQRDRQPQQQAEKKRSKTGGGKKRGFGK